MHWKGYLPIYINQFRSYQPIYIDTTRHHQTCIRHHQTPPDMHQTISDRLAVVLWWFIELYSWSRFFLPTGGRTNEGNPRGPRGPKKVASLVFCQVWFFSPEFVPPFFSRKCMPRYQNTFVLEEWCFTLDSKVMWFCQMGVCLTGCWLVATLTGKLSEAVFSWCFARL